MKHSETRQRTTQVGVRMSPEEYAAALVMARRLNVKTVPDLLRLGLTLIQMEEARDALHA